jgi:hypothetical protein
MRVDNQGVCGFAKQPVLLGSADLNGNCHVYTFASTKLESSQIAHRKCSLVTLKPFSRRTTLRQSSQAGMFLNQVWKESDIGPCKKNAGRESNQILPPVRFDHQVSMLVETIPFGSLLEPTERQCKVNCSNEIQDAPARAGFTSRSFPLPRTTPTHNYRAPWWSSLAAF